MKEPKVELKKVKTFQGTEGLGFNADVYIDGIKCMLAIDSAYGGCYDYQDYDPREVTAPKIKQLKEYIKSLPARPMIIDGEPYRDSKGKVVMIKPDIDSYINDRLIDYLQAQSDARYEKNKHKKMANSILFGKPNSTEFVYYSQKNSLLCYKTEDLQAWLDKLVAIQYPQGNVCLNTNLTALGLKINYK